MMKDTELQFEGLKLWLTEFNFKNKRAFNEHFDNLLRIGVEPYKAEIKRYMKEVMHVFMSYFVVCRAMILANLVMMALSTDEVRTYFAIATGIFTIGTIVMYRFYTGYSEKYYITTTINDIMDEFLYETREEMLKEEENNKKIDNNGR